MEKYPIFMNWKKILLRRQYSPCYRSNTILIKIKAGCFLASGKLILKFIRKCKGPRVDKTKLRKDNQVGELTLPVFTYCNAVVSQMMWYQHKARHINQQDLIDTLEIDPYIYGQLISNQTKSS